MSGLIIGVVGWLQGGGVLQGGREYRGGESEGRSTGGTEGATEAASTVRREGGRGREYKWEGRLAVSQSRLGSQSRFAIRVALSFRTHPAPSQGRPPPSASPTPSDVSYSVRCVLLVRKYTSKQLGGGPHRRGACTLHRPPPGPAASSPLALPLHTVGPSVVLLWIVVFLCILLLPLHLTWGSRLTSCTIKNAT